MDAISAIETRRSLRRFNDRPVPDETVRRLVALACVAPAPHHTRPWRFVLVRSGSRVTLADAMGEAWRRDLRADGVDEARIEALLRRSRRQLRAAPVLLLACLAGDGLRRWPDARRAAAEWAMAQHSLGAALENALLAAHALGLAAYWISAPLFCPEAVRRALGLPNEFAPQALIAVGYPAPALEASPRPGLDLSTLLVER